jgi:phosphoserine phosphatase RsbU/P
MRRSLSSVLLVSLASLSLLLCAASGLHAQTFNLQTGREPVTSLDGLWRFHTGDNPAWADPNFDDSQWPLLRSDEAWGQQGYKNYGGFAWYRFTVAVPEGSRNWSIYLGPIETGYQLFVDGRLAGSYGPILNFRPYSASSRAFAISPAAASGPRTFHIAIRAWHAPVWADYAPGGFSVSAISETPSSSRNVRRRPDRFSGTGSSMNTPMPSSARSSASSCSSCFSSAGKNMNIYGSRCFY